MSNKREIVDLRICTPAVSTKINYAKSQGLEYRVVRESDLITDDIHCRHRFTIVIGVNNQLLRTFYG